MNKSTAKTPISISLGVIGGSGAYDLLANKALGENINTLTLETPFGESAPIHHFRAGNLEYLFLSRHGEKDYSITAPFVNYRANIYALNMWYNQISWQVTSAGQERFYRDYYWSGFFDYPNNRFKTGTHLITNDAQSGTPVGAQYKLGHKTEILGYAI